MKSEKLKKLLKQIKKLKKLRKLRKNKKSSSEYLKVNAEIEALKEKIKSQENQMSQMKNPQQMPISTVRYEKIDGQQNALNQLNLENIQKNIETKLNIHPITKLQSGDQNNKYSDIINGIESGQYKIKPTKYGLTITNPGLYKKVGRKPKVVTSKSIEEVNESSGIKSKINTNNSTPQKPIYDYNDDAGEFPATEFNKDINIINQIPDESTFEINQPFVDTTPNESVFDIKDVGETINQPFVSPKTDEIIPIKQTKVKKLSKAQQKKLKSPKPEKSLSKAQLKNIQKEIEKAPVQLKQEIISNNLSNLQDVPPAPDLSGFERIDNSKAFSDY